MKFFRDSPIGWKLRRNAIWRRYGRIFRGRKAEASYEQFYRSAIGAGDGLAFSTSAQTRAGRRKSSGY
jgi:hypothetical protein